MRGIGKRCNSFLVQPPLPNSFGVFQVQNFMHVYFHYEPDKLMFEFSTAGKQNCFYGGGLQGGMENRR